MKISANWLRACVRGGEGLTVERIEEVLTFAGFPIESIERPVPGDALLDVEVTSNRGDVLCHVGCARELAAGLGGTGAPAPVEALSPLAGAPAWGTEGPGEAAAAVSLQNRIPAQCRRFTLRVVRGVKVGPSPAWLRQRLESIGQRSISNVVDVTNFVLHELGHPSHVFDLAKVAAAGGAGQPGAGAKRADVVVRAADKGERLRLLDGREVELAAGEMVVCAAGGGGGAPGRVLSLAGVMGGAETAVAHDTTDVLVEVATWEPAMVRRASRRLGVRTDSSFRYERVVDPRGCDAVSARIAGLIVEVAGGTVVPGLLAAGPELEPETELALRPARCAAYLGVGREGATGLGPAEIAAALVRLGFGVRAAGGPGDAPETLRVRVPFWRTDVKREVDLIEEVARAVGYDRIPVHERIAVPVAGRQASEAAAAEAARVMTGCGYFETVTFSFTDAKQAALFMQPPGENPGAEPTAVSDERRGAEGVLRPSVLCGLLACRRRNQDARASQDGGVRLYETASAYAQVRDGAAVRGVERRTLAMLADLPAAGSAFERRQEGMRLIRGTIEALVKSLQGPAARPTLEPLPSPPKGFDAAACAAVLLDGRRIGLAGLVSDAALRHYDLAQGAAAAELEIDPLCAGYPPASRVESLPTFPAVERDLSLVVDERVRWSAVDAALRAGAPPRLEDVRFVGTYRGKPLDAGTKSVTLRMTFRDPERTLRDDEVTADVEGLVRRLAAEVGAKLRG